MEAHYCERDCKKTLASCKVLCESIARGDIPGYPLFAREFIAYPHFGEASRRGRNIIDPETGFSIIKT